MWKCTTLCTDQTTLCMVVCYIVYRLDNCIYGSVLHCVHVRQLYVWKCATLCTGQTTLCVEVYYIVYRSNNFMYGSVLHCVQVRQLMYGSVLHCVHVRQIYVRKCATLCTGQTTLCVEVYYIVYRSNNFM